MLLPSAYFGNLEYFKLLLSEDCVIEVHEHFIKQTFRNRCEIYGPQGKQSLSIPITRKNHMPIKDVRINYNQNWVKEHVSSIKTAYGKTPYFIHYADDLFSTLHQNHTYLVDLNFKLTEQVMAMLNIETNLAKSDSFVPYTDSDLRLELSPKNQRIYPGSNYFQAFADKHGFIPNLSIIDLLFNEGPASISYL